MACSLCAVMIWLTLYLYDDTPQLSSDTTRQNADQHKDLTPSPSSLIQLQPGSDSHSDSTSPWSLSPFNSSSNSSNRSPARPASADAPQSHEEGESSDDPAAAASATSAAATKARHQQLIALGYMVPPSYYQQNLATLKKSAAAGDAFAMVHLGEKYYFELNNQPDNPDFDPSENYPGAAKSMLSAAVVAGNKRAAGMIAELYLQEQNIVDAYAWNLLSERLGDNISVAWFRGTEPFLNMSEAEKQSGQAKAGRLVASMNLPAVTDPPPHRPK